MAEPSTNIVSKLEQTYATALLELVDDAHGNPPLEQVLDQMKQLAELTENQGDLIRLLDARTISVHERSAMLKRLFERQVDDLVYRFLQVVNRKNRLGHLSGIARAFMALVQQRSGIVEVEAHVALPMNPQESAQLAQMVGGVLGKQVVLNHYEDPKLIGGLKLRIGDQLIDGSVAAQLRQFRRRMAQAGRGNARLGAAAPQG